MDYYHKTHVDEKTFIDNENNFQNQQNDKRPMGSLYWLKFNAST